jgi:hypothetical protein
MCVVCSEMFFSSPPLSFMFSFDIYNVPYSIEFQIPRRAKIKSFATINLHQSFVRAQTGCMKSTSTRSQTIGSGSSLGERYALLGNIQGG